MEEDKVLDADSKKEMNNTDSLQKADSLRIFIIDKIFRWHNFIDFMTEVYSKYQKGFFSHVSYKNSSSIRLLPFGCLLSCLLLSACSMPRIIVLDDPLTPEEHINLGVAYEKKGELDNALKEYKEASKKLPSAYLYIGNMYFQKNEFDEAESSYEKAIKADSGNADAYNNLAWLYYTKKENLEKAEELVLKALELDPKKNDVYFDTLEKIRALKGVKKD